MSHVESQSDDGLDRIVPWFGKWRAEWRGKVVGTFDKRQEARDKIKECREAAVWNAAIDAAKKAVIAAHWRQSPDQTTIEAIEKLRRPV